MDDEICAYIRGVKAKDRDMAIDVACGMYRQTRYQIVTILILNGLMDLDGKYIEPIRITGKENHMSKEQDIFRWSARRRSALEELYQENTPIEAIATHFGISDEDIYKAIDRFGIVQPVVYVKPGGGSPSHECIQHPEDTQAVCGYDSRLVAPDIIDVLVKHRIRLHMVDQVFDDTKDFLQSQLVQPSK